jgi:hypothetical protein
MIETANWRSMAERSFKEELDERIARRLFKSALGACERLPVPDQERLLKDFAKQILQRAERIRSADGPRTVGIVGVEIK